MNQTRRPRRRLSPRKLLRLLLVVAVVVFLIYNGVGYCRHAETPAQDSLAVDSGPHLNDSLTNEASSAPAYEEMNKRVERFLRRWEIKGAQLVVSDHGRLIYARGFGYADEAEGIAMEPGHIMRIASASKLITAVGIMKLKEEGRLHLSDRVFGPQGLLRDTAFTNAITDKRYYEITVEHLLRHQGGFSLGLGDPMFETRAIMQRHHLSAPPTNEALVRLQLRRPLAAVPGHATAYSNVGYVLLSMIIARVSGMPYEDYIQQHVLRPAHCYDFHIARNYYEERYPREVRYYAHTDQEPGPEFNGSGRIVERPYGGNDITRLSGAGAWVASAAELSRFVAAIDGDEAVPDILSPETVREMTTETDKGTLSIGWMRTPNDGEHPWKRTGTLCGTSALIARYPDGQCWILLTNTSTYKGSGLSNYTLRLFGELRKQPFLPQHTQPLPP